MHKSILVGSGCAALALTGWYYYSHPPKVPPAPRDLTKVLPKALLEKASPGQLAMFRGEATSAPLETDRAGRPETALAGSSDPAPVPSSNGLTMNFAADTTARLKGQVTNPTHADIAYTFDAGALFSNGSTEMVLVWSEPVKVLAGATLDVTLHVALTSSAHAKLDGKFTPHAGRVEGLDPLLDVFAQRKPSSGAMQTAVLAVTEDVPLDVVAGFPRLRPLALAGGDLKPLQVSTVDIVDALSLLKAAGVDTSMTAMTSEPQLKIMAMLNPDSHGAAMSFYGITEQTEWSFWKDQLLQGDPTLRHFALYGIARYYPDVALVMMPRWVRDQNLYHNYRVSAAWALALIDDARAQEELVSLRQEFKGDAGVRQAIDRALRHRDSGRAPASRAEANAPRPVTLAENSPSLR